MKRTALLTLRLAGLVLAYVLLFIAGTQLFPVQTGSSLDASEASAALFGMFACASIDTILLGIWASGTRLTGYRAWAALAVAFYGVKTFTSQLEALWFMPNVTGPMAPALFGMTLPLALVLPALVLKVFGSKTSPVNPVWSKPSVSRAWSAAAWTVLCVVVYPSLFWSAGYFVAFQSAAVREFYGGLQGDGFGAHLFGVFRLDPWVFPFEVFRGWLWIVLVLPLIRTSRRDWLTDAWLTGAFLALVQNDVHFLPNPLMSPEIRLYHFMETASSNFVWGFVMVAVLRGWCEHLARRGKRPPV